MEDTLRESVNILYVTTLWILILVLMEDTLRAKRNPIHRIVRCLNPCFNGRYSQRGQIIPIVPKVKLS